MVGNYKVITLCGSTRFKDAFLQIQKQLTPEGRSLEIPEGVDMEVLAKVLENPEMTALLASLAKVIVTVVPSLV